MRFLALLPFTALIGLAGCAKGASSESEATAKTPTESAAMAEKPAMAAADAQGVGMPAKAMEASNGPAATPPAGAEAQAAPVSIPAPAGSLAGEPMAIGSPDAKLTIIEYASVTCPACAAFHTQILPEIKAKYIDTGLVRLEFREFPTNPQNLAYAGFYLARCSATTKGSPAYFAMLGTLFERQREWAYGPQPGQTLETIAAEAGIDRAGLEACFFREDIKAAVKANIVRGLEEDEVKATPTFVVDGEELDWGRSPQGMMDAIDKALAAKQ
jgi:protein-disulfide isomerase